MDILSHFGELDELIQVIYQGFDRFVVLSTVTESSWTVSVGLKGPEGRWWRGSWSAGDIKQFVGQKPSSEILENVARDLSEAFVKGDLRVGDWSDKGAKINLTLGSPSKNAAHMSLVELSAKQAASYATTVLSEIALQAQSRKCRLNPPMFSETVTGPSHARPGSSRKRTHVNVTEPAAAQAVNEARAAQRKIKALEAELEHVKKVKSKSPSSEAEPKPSVSTRRPKGASLANPHKKARKYEAVEFESD